MRTYGTIQCNTIRTQTGEAKLGSTYYDLESIAYQMAAYTGSSSWNTCANDAEIGYREGFVIPNGGALPGYWVFTDGLRRDYELFRDERSRSAVDLLAKHGSFCAEDTPIEWSASASYIREDSYCLNAYLDNEALGAGMTPRGDDILAQLLDQLDATITGRYKAEQDADVPDFCKGRTYAQPFYMGLAMRSLIKWNARHPDTRILPAVKRLADWMWDQLRYKPTSATSGARFWYGQCSASAGGPFNVWTEALGNLPADDLNLLIAPGYAWLYKQTGDVKYRDRGDQIWTVGINDATLNGLNSKQFNQNYMWSFDFVKYRR
jgi:hypothetical protein